MYTENKEPETTQTDAPALGMSLCCVSVASDELATKNRTFFVFIFWGGVFNLIQNIWKKLN